MDEAFSGRLRRAVVDLTVCPTCRQRRYSMRAIARLSGVAEPTLRRFLAGGEVRLATVDRLLAWLRANGADVPS
jgi:hypothetical protein